MNLAEQLIEEYIGLNSSVIEADYKNEKTFIKYLWDFYGPNQIYGKKFFDNSLTMDDLTQAAKAYMKKKGKDFEGDSIDREAVRDILLKSRKNKK